MEVWQLAGPADITSRPAGATPTITELRRGRVESGFAEPVRLALADDPALAAEIAHHGADLIAPQGRECLPQPEFLAWYRAEVFKAPAREQREALLLTQIKRPRSKLC